MCFLWQKCFCCKSELLPRSCKTTATNLKLGLEMVLLENFLRPRSIICTSLRAETRSWAALIPDRGAPSLAGLGPQCDCSQTLLIHTLSWLLWTLDVLGSRPTEAFLFFRKQVDNSRNVLMCIQYSKSLQTVTFLESVILLPENDLRNMQLSKKN